MSSLVNNNILLSRSHITNILQIPSISSLKLQVEVKSEDQEVFLWFFYIITGQRPKWLKSKIRRNSEDYKYNLLGYHVTLRKKQLTYFLLKLTHVLCVVKEKVDFLYVKKLNNNMVNFKMFDFCSYKEETFQLMNSKGFVDNFPLRFEFLFNSKNKKTIELLFRLYQIALTFNYMDKFKDSLVVTLAVNQQQNSNFRYLKYKIKKRRSRLKRLY